MHASSITEGSTDLNRRQNPLENPAVQSLEEEELSQVHAGPQSPKACRLVEVVKSIVRIVPVQALACPPLQAIEAPVAGHAPRCHWGGSEPMVVAH